MSNELTVKEKTKQYLQSQHFIQAIDDALPKHIDRPRYFRCLKVCFNKQPKLWNATHDSIYESSVKLAYLGLYPDGRQGHLLPYNNRKAGTVECQAMVDYKGFIELAYRSGEVSSIHADVIYEGDIFEVDLGIIKRHVPWYFRKDAERPDKKGKCVGAFCIVKMRHAEKHEVMDSDQLDSIRSRSQSRDSGPWVTDTDEMRKKTVFRRASKWIPISPDVSAALADDDDILEVEIPKRSISIESLRKPAIESAPAVDEYVVTEVREIVEDKVQTS